MQSKAIYISSGKVQCESPGVDLQEQSSVVVDMMLSLNNQEYFLNTDRTIQTDIGRGTTGPVQFEYIPVSAVESLLQVSEGTVGGGTVVTLKGRGFDQVSIARGRSRCRFGDVLVPVNKFITEF